MIPRLSGNISLEHPHESGCKPVYLTTMLSVLLLLVAYPGWGQSKTEISYRDGAVILTPYHSGKTFSQALQVYRNEISLLESRKLSPILGKYQQVGDSLLFRPLVAFGIGQHFTAIAENEKPFHFQIPFPEDYPYSRVAQVYPSADALPANLLKFHILFSQPMGETQLYEHITLHQANGSQIDRAFLELEMSLWNEDHTLLTLWIEPGRIKQDLGPNRRIGPVLEAGKEYELRISPALKDKKGVPLAQAFAKPFRVITADREKPAVDNWTITAPPPNTSVPLVIDFHESLDYPTALAYIRIEKNGNKPAPGALTLSANESQAYFTPAEPWQTGAYRVVSKTVLEDLAGNNLNREFDRDLEKAAEASEDKVFVELSFGITVEPKK